MHLICCFATGDETPAQDKASEASSQPRQQPGPLGQSTGLQETALQPAVLALTASSAQDRSPDAQSPESAKKLRDKYNRLFEMAESAPEGPLPESSQQQGVIDSFLNVQAQSDAPEVQRLPAAGQAGPDPDQMSHSRLDHPQISQSADQHGEGASLGNAPVVAVAARDARADTHLSLTEMLLLEEDSLAESQATPLLQHRVSMASNLADAFLTSPTSSTSPLHSERSIFASPDHPRPADSASNQQAEFSGGGGWPGPAPEWISVVMRGKHGGSRETFIQYHVPEGLVYVSGTNLSLKAS